MANSDWHIYGNFINESCHNSLESSFKPFLCEITTNLTSAKENIYEEKNGCALFYETVLCLESSCCIHHPGYQKGPMHQVQVGENEKQQKTKKTKPILSKISLIWEGITFWLTIILQTFLKYCIKEWNSQRDPILIATIERLTFLLSDSVKFNVCFVLFVLFLNEEQGFERKSNIWSTI